MPEGVIAPAYSCASLKTLTPVLLSGRRRQTDGREQAPLSTPTHTTAMSPASLARAVPIRGAARTVAPATRRYASHGHGPQFNEPSGWLFAEKVSCVSDPVRVRSLTAVISVITSLHRRVRNVRSRIGNDHGSGGCTAVWVLLLYCCTTSRIQRTSSTQVPSSLWAHFFGLCYSLASKRGLCKRPKLGWRPAARRRTTLDERDGLGTHTLVHLAPLHLHQLYRCNCRRNTSL